MEKRIELEKRGRNPEQIKDLNLDNCRSTSIVGLSDEYVNLETLSLINVGLTSLKGFPKLPNLKKLELSDNRISNGLNLLTTSSKLTYLNLSGNKIKDLDALQPLKDFKHLKTLDLFNNEATSIDNYREKIFILIPSLKCLDGYDSDDEEVDDSDGEEDELNGNENDSEDKEEVDEEEVEVLGLQSVYNEDLDEMSDEGDYEGEDDEEEENISLLEEEEEVVECQESEDEDGEPVATVRGKKRKMEDGDN